MYNSEIPNLEKLPSKGRLIRSTIIAILSAVFILVTIVLPSEYGIDLTGVGRAIGLAEMGEIKTQLAKEAEEDQLREQQQKSQTSGSLSDSMGRFVAGLFISTAFSQSTSSDWKDEIKVTLTPGKGAEIKLIMKKGAKANFSWTSGDGRANFALHGSGNGQNISYKKGRGVKGAQGVLEAAFDGQHGWFWRNRDKQPITIILRVKGAYTGIKKYL